MAHMQTIDHLTEKPGAGPGMGHSVLLIADAEDAAIVRGLMEKAGTALAIEWSDGFAAGIGRLKESGDGFGAVLLSPELPDSDELTILSRVREVNTSVPVIVLSKKENDAEAARVISHGAQDYLVKGLWNGFRLVNSITQAIERRGIEQAFRKSEAALGSVLSDSPVGIALVDKNRHIYWMNDAFARLVEYNLDDFHGRSTRLLYESETEFRRVGREIYRKASKQSVPAVDTVFVSKTGQRRNVMLSFAPIDPSGVGSGSIVTAVDITLRSQAEERFRLDELRLESLLKISQYEAGTIQELLDFALAEAIALTGSTVGYVYFYDESTRTLSPGASRTGPAGTGPASSTPGSYHLEATGDWGEPIRRRRPCVVNDFRGSGPAKASYPMGDSRIFRFLSIPVIVDNVVAAVAAVANKSSDYDDRDVRQLTLLMNSAMKYVEQRRYQEKLLEAAEEWRTTFDSIGDTIMILDRGLRITRLNRAGASFLNRPAEDILGRECSSFVHDNHIPPEGCPHAETVRTKAHAEVVWHDEARKKWFLASTDPVFDENRDVVSIVHTVRDITARKDAEEAIAKSEERYRNIFEMAVEGIFQALPDGRLVAVNDSLVRIAGFETPEEMIGAVNSGAYTVFVDSQERRVYRDILDVAGSVQGFEARVLRKDGSQLWVSLNTHVVKDPGGSVVRIEGTVQDIGDRKEILSELEAKNSELVLAYTELKDSQQKIVQQEKMASIGQLAAGVAHEINNPMGFIASNLDTLQKYVAKLNEFLVLDSEMIGLLSEEAPAREARDKVLARRAEARKDLKIDLILRDAGKLIAESLDGADRVKRIVQDLKSFSRLDQPEWALADINRTLDVVLNIARNELKYKADVIKEYGDIPMTLCNEGQLGQVFMNILVNAAQAIDKFGTITIRTERDADAVHITISDTGCGISEAHRGRIFEPFFTTKEVGKGTGLGLSIAYDIIKKHKGEIEVESEEGRGTSFSIKIPVRSQ